ncbi:hypothetical protein [Kiloniella antarctica]|uniref:Uncharacterized protein n=1 Tax=Kiloniella antarctica TaxID=1550907 RepID=A0ABW5BJB0_9PROT
MKSETILNHELEMPIIKYAQIILADYVGASASGLVRTTGPGFNKVICQNEGDLEPIESDIGERVGEMDWE